MADNWQEALVEELARNNCHWCEESIPYTSDGGVIHDVAGGYICTANRIGVREAIRRILERVAETADLTDDCPCPKCAALRQLMEPPK